MELSKPTLEKIRELVSQGYISCVKHPEADLFIFNYTHKAQWDKMWTEETLMCRGLITDAKGNVVARPFKKFFNLEEHQGVVPNEPFEVFEKYDGSLGILYWINDQPWIATRGSFTSEQARFATQLFRERYADTLTFNRDWTYLFEIIYPENRIVVDYGDMRDLVLLAVIDTATGKDIVDFHPLMPTVKKYDGITDVAKIKELQEDNKEGFVIRFQSGLRMKIKFDEYVRLHRLVTGVNAKSIWELLRYKQPFDDLLARVPDEFYKWVSQTKADLEFQYKNIEEMCLKSLEEIDEAIESIHGPLDKSSKEYRKAFAEGARAHTYPQVMFCLLDKKNYSEVIWKMLRPQALKPFKEDES